MYRGTTPTISYRMPFSVDQLAAASIAVAQKKVLLIEKKLDECEISGDVITADLTQEDTLKLDEMYPVEIQLRVRTLAGEALATEPVTVPAGRILRDGVI